jgi:hypothetical protein
MTSTYLLGGQRSSDTGESLCRMVDGGVATGPGHHYQLHTRAEEGGLGRLEKGWCPEPLSQCYRDFGPPGGQRGLAHWADHHRWIEATNAEGKPSHPLSASSLIL